MTYAHCPKLPFLHIHKHPPNNSISSGGHPWWTPLCTSFSSNVLIQLFSLTLNFSTIFSAFVMFLCLDISFSPLTRLQLPSSQDNTSSTFFVSIWIHIVSVFNIISKFSCNLERERKSGVF